MFISSNYAQIRCDKCKKVIHIFPDAPFEKIECDCKEEPTKPTASRAKPKPKGKVDE